MDRRRASPARIRCRRQPERGDLYQVLLRHLQTFIALADEREPGLPRFVRRELYSYLDCGILANGFARVHCASCGRDELVAFACKGRGFCPSCCGRRMADSAMHLADEVLPAVTIRQWVLSFPYPLRLALAYDATLCAAVRRILVSTILGWHAARAAHAGVARGRSGAVVVAQRFGSALNLNLHFHALVLDGVYASSDPFARPRFRPAEPLTDRDVVEVTALLHRRILRHLSRTGPLRRNADELEREPAEPILAQLYAVSVQGRGDGTRAVVFAPLDFIARLAALVPRPRVHLLTYHGVLAPAAEWRDWIVPAEPRSTRRDPSQIFAVNALRPALAKKRATWAELLKRLFEIDVLTCPWCGGKRKLIALITDGKVVRRILEHLGLPTATPVLAPARSPPELEFAG